MLITKAQKAFLSALEAAPAPLPLVEADALGVSRQDVTSWLSQAHFSAEFGKIRANWVRGQLTLLNDADLRSAPRIKWMLSIVDPDTFDPKSSAKAKPRDMRQNAAPSPGRKLNMEDLERPEP